MNEYNILEGDIMPPDEDANKISITAGMPMPHDWVNQYDDQEELQNENNVVYIRHYLLPALHTMA